MKKAIALLLALAMVLPLYACGAKEEKSNRQEVTQTETAVPETEENDSNTVAVQEETVEVQASVEQVEITIDNWEDYFTIDFYEDWNINGFGEADALLVGYRLNIKDAYADSLTNLSDSEINMEYSYQPVFYHCDYDFSAKTYTVKDKDNSFAGMKANTDTKTIHFDDSFKDGYALTWGNIDEFYNDIIITENFEVLHVQGKIFLLVK